MDKKANFYKKGFTIIEILIVIAIIGMLATVVLTVLHGARANARDAVRLQHMDQIRKGLTMYYENNGTVFPNADPDFEAGSCDTPGDGEFIHALQTSGLVREDYFDPLTNDNSGNYRYCKYAAGSAGCDASKGAFYVLGVVDMEVGGNPHTNSPGFSCSGRNWQNEMEWVTGRFEND